jgi:hypothetical protein
MVPFENDNIAAYRLLLTIEVALRELVRTTFQEQFGSSWRKRLPGPLLTKVREAERDEDSKRQFDFARLGPLYYLTMGELIEDLAQAPAKPVLDLVGGSSFLSQLQNLLPVRNAVGHSRAVSSTGLLSTQAIYQQLLTALGEERLRQLLSHPDIGLRSPEAAVHLLEWFQRSLRVIRDLESPCPQPTILQQARDQHWWGNTGAATFDCRLVEEAAAIVNEYNAIPMGLGSRDLRRRFIDDRSPLKVIESATRSLVQGSQ